MKHNPKTCQQPFCSDCWEVVKGNIQGVMVVADSLRKKATPSKGQPNPQEPINRTLEDLARDRGQVVDSGQPSVEVEKILGAYENWCINYYTDTSNYKNTLSRLEAKAQLLAHDLSCLPEKWDEKTAGTKESIMWAQTLGFNKAIDLMAEKLKEGYGGKC